MRVAPGASVLVAAIVLWLPVIDCAQPLHPAPAPLPSTHRWNGSRPASFEGLGDLPGGASESAALRISANGSVIVGSGTTESGKQAFRWSRSSGMIPLGNLRNSLFKECWAVSLSGDGTTIVGYGDPGGSSWENYRGFLWRQDIGMTEINSIRGPVRQVFDVSADGSVLAGDDREQAFRWTKRGGAERLGVLPSRTHSRAIAVSSNGSVIIGSSYNLPSWDKEEAYVWTRSAGMQALGTLPDKSSSFPNAISPEGSVVVGTSGSAAFRWTAATGMQDIGHLPDGRLTHPSGVSSNGKIVVGASYANRDHSIAFIWDAVHGMRSLQDLLQSEYGLDLSGWHLLNASAINPDGSVIVGWGTNPLGNQEAFRVIMPPPSR